jgi:UDP-glucuronate decarboxylase
MAKSREGYSCPVEKRILVTGGAGFVGSHLCERLLSAGHHVICMDTFFTGRRSNVEHLLANSSFELIRHDVEQAFTMEVDEVYHLACPASPIHYQRNPVRTIRTAFIGTLNALEVAREARATILIASTSEVYGDPLEHPQNERYWGNVNPIGPRSCYDEGKRCAESLATAYAQQCGVEVRIARIFNTYGPRMQERDGRVVSSFIVQALRNEPITIFGNGGQTRSFCYVTDLIDGLVRLMASRHGPEPINLGNPAEVTIREMAELSRRLAASQSIIVSRPLPQDDPLRRCPDITRARTLLDGWQPKVQLQEGLLSTIEYFRNRLQSSPGKPAPTATIASVDNQHTLPPPDHLLTPVHANETRHEQRRRTLHGGDSVQAEEHGLVRPLFVQRFDE